MGWDGEVCLPNPLHHIHTHNTYLSSRSIGVSNFEVEHFKIIFSVARIIPAVNQVRYALTLVIPYPFLPIFLLTTFQLLLPTSSSSISRSLTTYPQIHLHPYNYAESKPVLDFCAQHKIIVEAYSSLE